MAWTGLKEFLSRAAQAYYEGKELLISDEQYDKLCDVMQHEEVGYKSDGTKVKHYFPMYSLKKHFKGEGTLPDLFTNAVSSPKMDGAAVSILYIEGRVVQMLTRGDGEFGVDVTDKIAWVHGIPDELPGVKVLQITGEIVVDKEVPNARNYVSGALNLKDVEEFGMNREPMRFIAYAINPFKFDTYKEDMQWLEQHNIDTVTTTSFDLDRYPTDGLVLRVNDNIQFANLGYTSHHPRGAIAVKERKDGQFTKLLDVVWQVGKSGKVTPVAILEPVNIDGATVSRATLNNVNFIKALDLRYGDEVEVIRSGEIIPCIVGKRNLSIDN